MLVYLNVLFMLRWFEFFLDKVVLRFMDVLSEEIDIYIFSYSNLLIRDIKRRI